MEETVTSNDDQPPAAAEEKGESVYHLTSVLSNYVFQSFSDLVFMQIFQFWFSFYIQHLEKWLFVTIFTDSGTHLCVSFLMDITE